MNKQEYYDELVRRSAAGLFPAWARTDHGSVRCLYRTYDGRKCAFGVVIPDSLYSPQMEALNAKTVIGRFPGVKGVLPAGMEVGDFAEVQQIHDSMAAPAQGNDARDDWDHSEFVQRLNQLPCFSDVVKQGESCVISSCSEVNCIPCVPVA